MHVFGKYNGLVLPCAQDNVVLYKGPNIQKILEDAIEDFKLHTLVLGMAAVGYERVLRHMHVAPERV